MRLEGGGDEDKRMKIEGREEDKLKEMEKEDKN